MAKGLIKLTDPVEGFRVFMDSQDVSQHIMQPEPAGYVNQARLRGCICRVMSAGPLVLATAKDCPLHGAVSAEEQEKKE